MPTNVYEKKVFNLILNFLDPIEPQFYPINDTKKKPDVSGLLYQNLNEFINSVCSKAQ